MPHDPQWHILDNDFASADAGLQTPARLLAHGNCRLAIANLDRKDPPGYIPGGVPRSDFNDNLFRLTARPRMPAISVSCAVEGFDPSSTPLLWRLVCRHVLCRHADTGYCRYRGAAETFDGEWRGESHTPDFTAFGTAMPIHLQRSDACARRSRSAHGGRQTASGDAVRLRARANRGHQSLAGRRVCLSRCAARGLRREHHAHGPGDFSGRVGSHSLPFRSSDRRQ